jgi:hypothetical protein
MVNAPVNIRCSKVYRQWWLIAADQRGREVYEAGHSDSRCLKGKARDGGCWISWTQNGRVGVGRLVC